MHFLIIETPAISLSIMGIKNGHEKLENLFTDHYKNMKGKVFISVFVNVVL